MKRTISLLLSLVLLLALLPACGQTDDEQDAPVPEALLTARELAEAVLPASGREDALDIERLNTEEDADRLSAYIEAARGTMRGTWCG